MKPDTSDIVNELTLAEASAWLTRLQEPERSPSTEAAFREWLAAAPTHARAFARVTDIWELIPGAAEPLRRPIRPDRRHSSGWPVARIAVAALGVVLLAVAGFMHFRAVDPIYQTAVGAQQTVVLDDATRVTLNTDTRLVVAYRSNERRILLERGEALFEVEKNPERPFIVQAADERVIAVGTVFDVRRDPTRVAVTLLEGKVQVGTGPTPSSPPAPAALLAPGDRLTIHADGRQERDRPKLDTALAWRQGQTYFDDASLAEAAAELNRYGTVQIQIVDPKLRALRVSGVFSTRDPAQFASAMASLHGLRIRRDGSSLVLSQ